MKCNRPDCTGTIDTDGYCDECGLAPPREATAAVAAAPAVSAVSAVTTAIRRPVTTRTATTTRPRFGAGLVEFPPIVRRDPTDALLTDPQVPEEKRRCAACDTAVGRSRAGQPGRVEGFCPKCGRGFSFKPALSPGDVVANQYEIAGCIAHGGLGWIYLARDRNVADRWVVLKGLLDRGDDDAMAAAIAERQFLAEVEHPNIVKIYNFVEHEDAGYIVMEYIDGTSLRGVLAARRDANGGEPDPLPVAEAIAYVLEILPALGYLHALGLMFCDFKPDNVMLTPNGLKLIDLGGVYRLDDPSSAVYGTVGYQAPEIASTGPTVPSDLYTVARALAVMCTAFRGYQSTYRFTLPPRAEMPQYVQAPSLYRLLERATAPNPDDRFQTAEEMAAQLLGVLREVVAATTGVPAPGTSTLFTPELHTAEDARDWRALPVLQVSADDAGAAFLASLGGVDPDALVPLLERAPARTVEVRMRLARTLLDLHEYDEVTRVLEEIEADDPWEWRVAWYRALVAVDTDDAASACVHFETVRRAVPGEPAAQLALGLAFEADGDVASAADSYDVVSRTDPSFTSACFGLARCRIASGSQAGAVEAYERIPPTSSAYVDAQVAKVGALLDGGTATQEHVVTAAAVVEGLPLERERRARLTTEVLESALVLVQDNTFNANGQLVLGCALDEHDVRLGLERAYRNLARLASSTNERIALVDRANGIRPRTLL
jgi:serine/threonine-protein kinase PknG